MGGFQVMTDKHVLIDWNKKMNLIEWQNTNWLHATNCIKQTGHCLKLV